MASVEPAAGSTVTTATARNPAAMTARTGGRAPRATATSPAITPAQPSAIATHNDTVTNVAVRCSEWCHHGGPPLVGKAGTETFGPAAETTTMISTEATMAAAASQAARRVSSDGPGAAEPGWPTAPAWSFSLTVRRLLIMIPVTALSARP